MLSRFILYVAEWRAVILKFPASRFRFPFRLYAGLIKSRRRIDSAEKWRRGASARKHKWNITVLRFFAMIHLLSNKKSLINNKN